MKKLPIGIIIFGIIFILLGLSSLRGLITYFTYRSVAPYIHKAVMARVYETEKLIEKEKWAESEKIRQASQNLQEIKIQMQKYKDKYIKGKAIPLYWAIFIIFSLLTTGVFLCTGVSIFQLKSGVRNWISASFLAGFIWSLLCFGCAASDVFFITNLSDRFSSIIAQIKGHPLPAAQSFSIFRAIILFSPAKKIIIAGYAVYLTLMSATSIYFARPKVKELFN
jgi:cytochrome b subunit of formate dehydrogenase